MLSALIVIIIALAAAIFMWARRRVASKEQAPDATPWVGSLEADAETLRALREAGADLTKPTEVTFYLYFARREVAERAAASAGTPQLTATVRRAATGDTWLCYVTGTMVPSESAIRAESTRLAALTSSLGGEYDGWEAAVTT